ncbi:hypothetical protein AB0M29_19345 [Streptomyces sp. NPDC051976]|uniref:hypothetical protein n=1 Tax=Streptomyces sp. NPDC051976 TaxID=3154947 RepID=UPI003427192A
MTDSAVTGPLLASDPNVDPTKGSVLRAEVGDTIVVHFRNADHRYRWPHSPRTTRGNWLHHCHVVEHMAGGMVGHYRVST